MEATRPRRMASCRIVGRLRRESGNPCSCGNSQASALMATTTLGGKAGRAPAARPLLQAGHTLRKDPLAPLADDLPTRIQSSGDCVVPEPIGRVERDLGPDDVTIRRRILSHDRLKPFPLFLG